MPKKKAKELRMVSNDESAVNAWVNDSPVSPSAPNNGKKIEPKKEKIETKAPEKVDLVAITYYAPKEHAKTFRQFAFEAERSRSSIIYEEMEKFLAAKK